MKGDMEKRVTQLTLAPAGEPIFSEEAFQIEIADEAGGESVIVHSCMPGYDKIAINTHEWESLKVAIDEMIKECRS